MENPNLASLARKQASLPRHLSGGPGKPLGEIFHSSEFQPESSGYQPNLRFPWVPIYVTSQKTTVEDVGPGRIPRMCSDLQPCGDEAVTASVW